jgi:hypothetical protein
VSSYKIARRAFLRSAGAASAFLAPILRSIEARAQGVPAPLRLLIIHHPLGTQHKGPSSSVDLWRPSATATTTTFTLPQNSAPFNPLKPKMVMIDGLNIVTASQTPGGNNGGNMTHEGGVVAVMTGVPTLGPIGQQDHAAGGPSMDQLFLDQSPVLGGNNSPSTNKTKYQYLALAADIRSDRDEVAPRVLSYRPPLPITLPATAAALNAARQPLMPETEPLNIYNRLFGGVMGTSSDPAVIAAKLAQQQSVIDYVNSDLARMRTLVPAAETTKLDAFAVAIQQLESSLKGGAGCSAPMMPETFAMNGAGASGGQAPVGGSSMLHGVDYFDPSDPNNHPHQRLGMQQLAMIQAAFQCDFVRVATFMWSAGTNWVVFPTAFQGAMLGGAGASSPHHPPSHTTTATTMSWLAQIDTWYATQNSAFIQGLDMAKDVDGNSLLDNTVVVYLSEIARAYDHDQRNTPVLVFGGKNTKIKGGQYLKVTDGPLPSIDGVTTANPSGNGNRPFNDLWLALAPIFGVNLPSLGTVSGSTIQHTGPLPGLVSS